MRCMREDRSTELQQDSVLCNASQFRLGCKLQFAFLVQCVFPDDCCDSHDGRCACKAAVTCNIECRMLLRMPPSMSLVTMAVCWLLPTIRYEPTQSGLY